MRAADLLDGACNLCCRWGCKNLEMKSYDQVLTRHEADIVGSPGEPIGPGWRSSFGSPGSFGNPGSQGRPSSLGNPGSLGRPSSLGNPDIQGNPGMPSGPGSPGSPGNPENQPLQAGLQTLPVGFREV